MIFFLACGDIIVYTTFLESHHNQANQRTPDYSTFSWELLDNHHQQTVICQWHQVHQTMGFPHDPVQNSRSSLESVPQSCWGIKENVVTLVKTTTVSTYVFGWKKHLHLCPMMPFLLHLVSCLFQEDYCKPGLWFKWTKPDIKVQTFCYHLCLVVKSVFSYLGFQLEICFLHPHKSLLHLWKMKWWFVNIETKNGLKSSPFLVIISASSFSSNFSISLQ